METQRPTILVIEDEHDYSENLVLLFGRSYNVLRAETGQQGLDILTDQPNISGIVLDYTLPDMDGLEALKKIREIWKDGHVFLHTAYTEHSIPELSEAMATFGPVMFLEKVTYSGKLLIQAVASAIGK